MDCWDKDLTSSTASSDNAALHMGDGWCSFSDLDNFDNEKLLNALTLKEKNSSGSIWDPSLSYSESCQRKGLSISALRQLEALFNLSQLLFGLSRAETVNYTFRDLQLRKCPRSFKKSGFKMLQSDGRIDFYAVFESLVHEIIQEGGLETTLLIYKNPMLPMVRQKCLDLISNLSTVPDVATKVIKYQSWFLDHLLIMVRDGDLVSDKIPALSVLIRMLKVMLIDRIIVSYTKLIDLQYIDCIVDILEDPKYADQNFVPFFIKFEFISMQSLTVILGDHEYSQFWSDKAKSRLLKYCMIVLLKSVGASTENNLINHIYYAEKHANKHSLAHTIMTVTELLRHNENMKLFYRYHKPFKQLIVQLIEKYGAKSKYIRTDPGISYALNHLMRVLYIKNTNDYIEKNYEVCKVNEIIAKKPRVCSYSNCNNEETKYKLFNECSNCYMVAYCSRKCKKNDKSDHQKCCLSKYEFEITSKNNYESFDQSQRNVSKSGRRIQETISYSKTKKISKFSSLKENKHITATHSRYAKYTANSFKENYSRRHSIDQGGNRFTKKNADDHSIQFIKPLKTSTVVCLAELNNDESIDEPHPPPLPPHHVDNSIKKSDEKKSQINEDERTRRHSCNFSAAFKSKGIYSAFTNTIPIEDKEEKSDLKKQQKTTANELTEILDQIRYHIPESDICKIKINNPSAKANNEDDNYSDTSSISSTNTSSSSTASTSLSIANFYYENGIQSQDNDEIEGERELKYTRDLKAFGICDSYLTNNLISDDEQERRSQLKVMKEFERTLNFANNMTKVGYQSDSNSIFQLKHLMDTAVSSSDLKPLAKPQISLETLYYDDKVKSSSKCMIKENQIDTKESAPVVGDKIKEKKAFTAINEDNEGENINSKEPVKSESNLFKKPSLLFSSNRKESKISSQSINQKKTLNSNHLKDLSINSNSSSLVNCCPQESTPIYKCESSANARRKYLLSKLDFTQSTFRRASSSSDKENMAIRKCDMIPELSKSNEIPPAGCIQTNDKQEDVDILGLNGGNVKQEDKIVNNKPLNISQYVTLNNASATSTFVVISKTDVPKDFKKTLKEEIKKEKKNCTLQ